MAARVHDPYCERSAALGQGFPDLVGGVIGLAVGLARGSVLAARRLAEDAIWMDSWEAGERPCGCHRHVHRVVVSECGPCPCSSCCSWCR
jgi:hypothetical protein